MFSTYALGRLVWRPSTLILLFPVVLSLAFFLFADAAASNDPLTMLGVSDPGIVRSLWRAHATLALIGAVVTIISREPQSAIFGWSLPGLDRQLFRVTAGIAVVCALPVSATFATVAGASMGLAMFGSSLLAFAIGMELADPVRNGKYRVAIFLLLILALWKPEYPHRAAVMSPLFFAVVGISAFVFLLIRSHDRATMRQRPFVADLSYGLPGTDALQAYWAKRKIPQVTWSKPLRRAGVRTWLSAAMYESYNGRNGGWPRYVAVSITLGVGFAYALNGPWFVALSSAQVFSLSGLQLRMRTLYPLSRKQQAKLNFVFSLFENAVICGVSAIAIWLLYSYGPGHLLMYSDRGEYSPGMAAGYVAVAFALSPVAQWGKTRGPILTAAGAYPQGWNWSYLYWMAFMVLYIGITTPQMILNMSARAAWTAALVLAVFVQTVYWFALRWHFSRADLVVRSS